VQITGPWLWCRVTVAVVMSLWVAGWCLGGWPGSVFGGGGVISRSIQARRRTKPAPSPALRRLRSSPTPPTVVARSRCSRKPPGHRLGPARTGGPGVPGLCLLELRRKESTLQVGTCPLGAPRSGSSATAGTDWVIWPTPGPLLCLGSPRAITKPLVTVVERVGASDGRGQGTGFGAPRSGSSATAGTVWVVWSASGPLLCLGPPRAITKPLVTVVERVGASDGWGQGTGFGAPRSG
jgi:hypothetical protein